MESDSTVIALVTGGGRGIGQEIAAGLGRAGMTVLVAARNPDRAGDVADRMRSDGIDAYVVRLDVTDPGSARAAAAWVEQRFGRLDVLVNNAGVSGSRDHQTPGLVDLDAIRAVFATNVFGIVAVTEAMLPLLRRSSSGRIVNMSSGLGSLSRMSDPQDYFAGLPAALGYAPSKSALNQLTVQYAKHLRAEGILVNAADPGPCATDFTVGFPGVTRTAADGAQIAIRLATLDDDGPTGGYFADSGPVPW